MNALMPDGAPATPDIVAFLTARLEEDAAMAHEAAAFYDDADENGVSWDGHEGENQNGFMNFWLAPHLGVIYDPASGRHAARHDPARVLAEVAAKRRVLARHHASNSAYGPWCVGCGEEGQQEMPRTQHINECPELRDLATAYADHPDYDESWRP